MPRYVQSTSNYFCYAKVFTKEYTDQDVLVLGLQYYHIARIVLILYTPSGQKHGYENIRETRKIEASQMLTLQQIEIAVIDKLTGSLNIIRQQSETTFAMSLDFPSPIAKQKILFLRPDTPLQLVGVCPECAHADC